MSDEEDEDFETTFELVWDEFPDKKSTTVDREGKGKATYGNGDTYEGEYAGGKKHGQGIYRFIAGSVYEGGYKEGKKHGKGQLTTTDGGIYDGEWEEDVRSGQGSYTYPNGDTFVGGWLKGKKHGVGKYTYAKTGDVVEGQWSAGCLMDGAWNTPDGSAYIGKFRNNKPDGVGLFMYGNGAAEAGAFEGSQWTRTEFTSPSLDASPPEPVAATEATRALREVQKATLTCDQAEGVNKVKKAPPGCANYRRVKGFTVWGGAQPTVEGFNAALEELQEAGGKVTWVNLRAEPIVYAGNKSYSVRDASCMEKEKRFDKLDAKEVTVLEGQLMDLLKRQVGGAGNTVSHHKETYGDHPEDRKWSDGLDEVEGPSAVLSLKKLQDQMEEEHPDVDYKRLPIENYDTPTNKDMENLFALIKEAEAGGTFFFQCRSGLIATGMAIAMAACYKRTKEEEEKEEDAPDITPQEYEPKEPRKRWAQFKLVMGLVAAMGENGALYKAELDDVLEKGKASISLRTLIDYCRDKRDKEQDENRKVAWVQMARGHLYNYCRLLLWYQYLKETAADDSAVQFESWLGGKEELTALVGTPEEGPVSSFMWEV